MNALERFWAKVKKTNGCWNWTGGNDGRYGQFYSSGFRVKTHRFAYENFVGPIPPGKLVCHHCDNGFCVRPDHLFIGSMSDNILDSVKKGRFKSGRAFGSRNGSHTKPERMTRGMKHHWAKLTDNQVREIRKLQGKTAVRTLALRFGVHPDSISNIYLGKTWCHIV